MPYNVHVLVFERGGVCKLVQDASKHSLGATGNDSTEFGLQSSGDTGSHAYVHRDRQMEVSHNTADDDEAERKREEEHVDNCKGLFKRQVAAHCGLHRLFQGIDAH